MAVAKKDPNTYSSQTNGELKMIFKDKLKTKKTVRRKKQEPRNYKMYLLSLVFSWFLFFFFLHTNEQECRRRNKQTDNTKSENTWTEYIGG